MTQYSIFSQTLPAGTGIGGPDTLDLGVQWEITASGYQLDGYWFYVPAGGDTTGSDYSFRLYSTTNGTSGTLISGSTVSGSGTWTAGTWVHTALATPVTLVSGTVYVAVVTLNGEYQSLGFYWTTGGGSSNIVNGPVTAFSAANAFNNAQQPFNEPSTGGLPVTVFGNSFYGVDIDVGPVSSNVTATGAVAMAAMAVAGSEQEIFTSHGTVAMASMAVAGTGTVTGANVTSTGTVAMAGMRVQGSGPQGKGGAWSLPVVMAAV